MASTDYDFKANRTQIIEQAFRIVGVLEPGDVLTGEQEEEGVFVLNEIIKSWQSEGVYVWNQQWLNTTLSADTAAYDLSTDPAVVAIEQAYYRTDATGTDHPIEIISWDKYTEISDKSSSGHPTALTIDYANDKFYVWPVPTQTLYLYYLAIVKLQDWDDSAGKGQLPVRFERALIYQLAADLGDSYGRSEQWIHQKQQKATYLFRRAKASMRGLDSKTFVNSAF